MTIRDLLGRIILLSSSEREELGARVRPICGLALPVVTRGTSAPAQGWVPVHASDGQVRRLPCSKGRRPSRLFRKRGAPNLTSSLVAIVDTPSSVRVHASVLDWCWLAGYWFFKKRKNSFTLKMVVWPTAL